MGTRVKERDGGHQRDRAGDISEREEDTNGNTIRNSFFATTTTRRRRRAAPTKPQGCLFIFITEWSVGSARF